MADDIDRHSRGRAAVANARRSASAAWPGGRRGLLLDGGIAVVLAGLLLANGYLFLQLAEDAGLSAPGPVAFASGLVMCLVLAVRRRWPLTVLVVTAIAFTVYGFNHGYDAMTSSVALFIATVTAGSDGAPRVRNVVRAVVIAALFGTIFYAFYIADQESMPGLAVWFGQVYALVLNVFYFGAAWVLGDQIRLRRQREADLAERTAELSARGLELEAERERSAEKAAVDERLRIAREVHDVLGHHVSVMGVQAGAARRILASDPTRAGQAMEAIETSSRQAVGELQRVLRLLREPDDAPGPLAALGRVEELANEVRRAGVAVTLQVGELPSLPVDIDLAAVRVVQESLTNVLRHAGPGTSAWVKIVADHDALKVEVGDDGAGTPLVDPREGRQDGVAAGSGLGGMRERVELHGGTFDAGQHGPRGWRVRATIPCHGVAEHSGNDPSVVAAPGVSPDGFAELVAGEVPRR